MGAGGIHVFRVLKLAVFVDAFFDEYLFERREVQAFEQLAAAYEQFLAQQVFRILHTAAQHVADREEFRAFVVDDAAVGRNGDLAIGERIQGVDGFVARSSGCQVYQDFHLGGRVVVHLSDFYFSLFVGLEDAVYDGRGGLSERNLADGERLVVELLYLCPDLDRAAPHSVVVTCHVDASAREEVRIEPELLAAEVADGRVAKLAEIVREYLGRKSHGDAFGSLCKQQRELDGQGDGFLVPSVVGQLPLRRLGVEERVERELREPGLDVARRGCPVARQYVTPIALTVYEQVFLPELYKGVAYRSVAVRVELHGLPHDVRHFRVAAVVQTLHGVQYAPLHGFQTVAQMRHGPFQYDVGGIIQEPALIHAGELVFYVFVVAVRRVVGTVGFLRVCRFVAHVTLFFRFRTRYRTKIAKNAGITSGKGRNDAK